VEREGGAGAAGAAAEREEGAPLLPPLARPPVSHADAVETVR